MLLLWCRGLLKGAPRRAAAAALAVAQRMHGVQRHHAAVAALPQDLALATAALEWAAALATVVRERARGKEKAHASEMQRRCYEALRTQRALEGPRQPPYPPPRRLLR